jgi:hypothetical protein
MHMNALIGLAAGSVFLLAAGMPLAQDAKPPMSTPGATAPQAAAPMNMGGAMAQMDEHMQLMKALHEKVKSATTPEARKILMDRQREEMQDRMAMMEHMHAGGMMGGMGGGMMPQKSAPTDPKSQMQMMEKRMGMMEMMMQTMMDQQGMMAGAQAGMPR